MSKVITERGIGRALTPYNININAPAAGGDTSWFGPSAPMPPLAQEVGGRAWDYDPGFNLQTQPRASEAVSFGAMRAIADSYDPVRLIIERRKDQLTRLPWKIRAKHEGPGKRPRDGDVSAQIRGIISDVKAFFEHPAADDMSFRTWLRCLLEDLLVIDAPALVCDRDASGNLTALLPADGSTVRVVISDNGRPAREFRWDGQPFQWCGTQVTVNNYADLGFKITRGLLWPPVYGRTLKGMGVANLTAWDLIYRPMNLRTTGVYGHSPVEQIMQTVSTAFRRATSQGKYFEEGNMPEGIYGLPDTLTVDQVEQFQQNWDNLFTGNLGRRRQMRFMPGSGKFTAFKEPPLKTEFDEWLIRIVCFAFSYSPAAFVTLNNRSTAEQHERQSEKEGLEPTKAWATELINDVIAREFSEEVEFAFIEEAEIDPAEQAKILRGYAADGILSINEVRERLGEEPLPLEAANTPRVKTAATGYVRIDQGDVDAVVDNTTGGDSAKLAKAATVLAPPTDWTPVHRFTLGRSMFLPNLSKGGELVVPDASEAALLQCAGWVRKPV